MEEGDPGKLELEGESLTRPPKGFDANRPFLENCSGNVEGAAKWKNGTYVSGRDETTWFKIRNRSYSQWEGRNEMFERPHEPKPVENVGWGACGAACRELELTMS